MIMLDQALPHILLHLPCESRHTHSTDGSVALGVDQSGMGVYVAKPVVH